MSSNLVLVKWYWCWGKVYCNKILTEHEDRNFTAHWRSLSERYLSGPRSAWKDKWSSWLQGMRKENCWSDHKSTSKRHKTYLCHTFQGLPPKLSFTPSSPQAKGTTPDWFDSAQGSIGKAIYTLVMSQRCSAGRSWSSHHHFPLLSAASCSIWKGTAGGQGITTVRNMKVEEEAGARRICWDHLSSPFHQQNTGRIYPHWVWHETAALTLGTNTYIQENTAKQWDSFKECNNLCQGNLPSSKLAAPLVDSWSSLRNISYVFSNLERRQTPQEFAMYHSEILLYFTQSLLMGRAAYN